MKTRLLLASAALLAYGPYAQAAETPVADPAPKKQAAPKDSKNSTSKNSTSKNSALQSSTPKDSKLHKEAATAQKESKPRQEHAAHKDATRLRDAPAQKDPAPHPDTYDEAISEQAKIHGVPETLVHRVVMRESRYHPDVVHKSFLGLMQITYATARSMGYKGDPKGLLNPLTNLIYAVPYLANAYIVADDNEDRAVALYAAGYYYEAKRKHKLADLRTATSEPVVPLEPPPPPPPPEPPPNPVAQLFHALTGASQPAPAQIPQEAGQPVATEPAQPVPASGGTAGTSAPAASTAPARK